MNRQLALNLAEEAGITFVTESGVASATPEWIERFAALVAAAEREACAELTENFDACDPKHIAAAIRARGNDD